MKKLTFIFLLLASVSFSQKKNWDSIADAAALSFYRDKTDFHQQKQIFLMRAINETGWCGEQCNNDVLKWYSLHALGKLNDEEYEDLLQGELALIKLLHNK